jgi:mono/diheme cytochrome c family protein
MRKLALAAAGIVLAFQSHAQIAAAVAPVLVSTSKPLLARDGADAAHFRGSLVFFNYCVTCHGPNADGNGRAAKLYDPRPANLRESDKNDAYMRLIVQRGGKAVARSEFMPPWGEELTEEQIADVVSYLQAINTRRK